MVAAGGGGNDVAVDSWVVDDPTVVTTTTSTVPTSSTSTSTTSTGRASTTTTTTTSTTVAEDVTAGVDHQSDWWFGYCADVTVSNPTGRPVDWKVAVKIDGPGLHGVGTDWYQDGFDPGGCGLDWNRTVPPKGTRSFGFCANR